MLLHSLRVMLALLLCTCLTGCNKIETGETLDERDKIYIQSLSLLDSNEHIYKFYSNFKNECAGNFFTNKRIAAYWVDERDKSKDRTDYAYYADIKSISTAYPLDTTFCPYMEVTKYDGSSFRVYVEGEQNEVQLFFEEAMQLWKQQKH